MGIRTLGCIGYLWSIVTVSEGRRGNKDTGMHRILCVVTLSEGHRGNKDTGMQRILIECCHCFERASWEYANWDASDTYTVIDCLLFVKDASSPSSCDTLQFILIDGKPHEWVIIQRRMRFCTSSGTVWDGQLPSSHVPKYVVSLLHTSVYLLPLFDVSW